MPKICTLHLISLLKVPILNASKNRMNFNKVPYFHTCNYEKILSYMLVKYVTYTCKKLLKIQNI